MTDLREKDLAYIKKLVATGCSCPSPCDKWTCLMWECLYCGNHLDDNDDDGGGR